MGYDVMLFGTLQIDERARRRWKAAPLAKLAFDKNFPDQKTGLRSVEAVWKRLRASLDVARCAHTSSRWTVRALLPDDAWLDLSADVARAFAAAAACGAKGELVFAGWLTSGPGNAFRVSIEDGRATMERLSKASEKALDQHPSKLALEADIEGKVEAVRTAAAAAPDAFFAGAKELRKPLIDALAIIDAAKDANLLEVARDLEPYAFHREMSSAKALRAGIRRVDPFSQLTRLGAIVDIAGRLDSEAGKQIARQMLEAKKLPKDVFWPFIIERLVDTDAAAEVLARMRYEDVTYWLDLDDWVKLLARAKRLTNEALEERARAHFAKAGADDFAAAGTFVLLSAVLMKRKAYGLAPLWASLRREQLGAREYGKDAMQRGLFELLTRYDVPLPGESVALATLKDLPLIKELTRRLRKDPIAVFEEIGDQLSSGHAELTHGMLVVIGRDFAKKDRANVLRQDPRFVEWLVAIAPTVHPHKTDYVHDALSALATPRTAAGLAALAARPR